MIDVHCHILPALDDGAVDLRDSVAMARQAEQDGISVVCATPHIREDHNVNIEELGSRVAALETELAREGVEVRIAPGGEVAQLAAEGLGAPALARLSLDGGGWVLLEPAPGPLGVGLETLVARMAAEGLHALIAHPERHAAEGFEERLQELVGVGALIQWTAEFIALARPDELVMRLARDGFVHLLGSDCHSSRAGRPLRLGPAAQRLREVCSTAQVDWIVEDAPAAILRGDPVRSPWL